MNDDFDLLFWTIILGSFTDEEISALSRYAKWYENDRFSFDFPAPPRSSL